MHLKVSGSVLASIFLCLTARAQSRPPPEDYIPRTVEDLETLVAPIALYPDAILTQVLVATTYPDDVLDASRWLRSGNDPNAIDNQVWDLSVRGVAHYPGTLEYLVAHADWMNDLGDAFLHQERDVMAAVQVLRSEANAAGILVSNEQQSVVFNDDVIEVVPTDPDVIYIPQYDPAVVYVDRRYDVGSRWSPLVEYGPGVRVGGWLHHDYDWQDHEVYVGDWGRDRPWWQHQGRPDARGEYRDEDHRYSNYRPGTFRSNDNRTSERSGIGNVQAGRWAHDTQRAGPRPSANIAARQPNERPGTGYPRARGAEATGEARQNVSVPEENRGAIISRNSNRGQQSRERATAQNAAPPARQSTPQRVERPATPERAPAIQRTPAPERAPAPVRSSPSPARGGAPSGYQNGADTARSSERGSVSRGSSGAGHGHR